MDVPHAAPGIVARLRAPFKVSVAGRAVTCDRAARTIVP